MIDKIYYIGAIALIIMLLPIIVICDVITFIRGKDPCADEKYGSMF